MKRRDIYSENFQKPLAIFIKIVYNKYKRMVQLRDTSCKNGTHQKESEHMKTWKKAAAAASAAVLLFSSIGTAGVMAKSPSAESDYSWGTVEIGGGGFVSGIITGQNVMYARTDVGGAYKWDYKKKEWQQLISFINETDRGMLSIDALCIDPSNDDNVYMLCGCAYFSDARTEIFRSRDGGATWDRIDVTNLIQVHGNGYGRQCGESIAVDPDDPDTIYCGGDTNGLIVSHDGGDTWENVESFNSLGLFTNELNWPTWTDNVVKTTVGTDYVSANGISAVAIEKGKVYVGISDNTIGANVYVADVGGDNWEPLSDDLPTDAFPGRINKDANGDLLITYLGGLQFNGTGGGAYRYDIKTGKITDISPTDNSFGAVFSDPTDANKLVATTCGVWSSQLWDEKDWDADENGNTKVSWGDQFFRSSDGGATWESITPGNAKSWGGPLQADYLQDGGYSWIDHKAIHWCGAMVIDPRDPDRVMIASGNGVFACDNVWDELPVYYFQPTGIEEVVALDFVSIEGGQNFSAIGDYDGFSHKKDTTIQQHVPNMGSTGSISYCPADPDVMTRYAENKNSAYYSLDGGRTWTAMESPQEGGKSAITKLKDGYRFFHSTAYGGVEYSDDLGATWNSVNGINCYSTTAYFQVDEKNPAYVYVYSYYNNGYDPSAPKEYRLCVSKDYGQTFTTQTICDYDGCDNAGRIAYIDEGDIVLAGGWNGLYHVTDCGGSVEKLPVYYCKTVGYGAPKDAKSPNTLYMYGRPQEDDEEGLYRSVDLGQTWELINTQYLYGGTGNGNFIVGDKNEYGALYMSTVGCGIVYGSISGGENPDPATEPDDTILYGDADDNGEVDIGDVIFLCKASMGTATPTEKGLRNADVDLNGTTDTTDASYILQSLIGLVKLPVR